MAAAPSLVARVGVRLLRPARSDEPELMDELGHDPAILEDNLDDLRRVNRWLGGSALTIRALEILVRGAPTGEALSVLDLATGGADIPLAIARWARRRGAHARVVATDRHPEIIGLAARRAGREIELASADARVLPFADSSFDVVTCSLVLHHLGPEDAVAMMSEMRRVARRAVVVNDIVRNWFGFAGAWLLSRVASDNPLTRHDGPLSVRRAYTRAEMVELARRAGLERVAFRGFLGYRVAMTARLSGT